MHDDLVFTHWNYRVIEHVYEDGTIGRTIHEVHYEGAKPVAWTEPEATVYWEADEGEDAPRIILKRMLQALDKPILKETDFYATWSPSTETDTTTTEQ